MLGGSPIVVSGPYFTVQEADQITCLFNDTAVDGIFINNQQVLCVSPTLSQTGRVPFQLFVRGNTMFYGESVFVSGRLDVHMFLQSTAFWLVRLTNFGQSVSYMYYCGS